MTFQEIDYTLNRNNYGMIRGDTFKLRVDVKDQFGASKNITGFKVWFTVKNQVNEPDTLAVFKAASDDGSGHVTIVNASLGQVRCVMPSLFTQQLADAETVLFYDVQLRDASDEIITIEKGQLLVEPDVTRSV